MKVCHAHFVDTIMCSMPEELPKAKRFAGLLSQVSTVNTVKENHPTAL